MKLNDVLQEIDVLKAKLDKSPMFNDGELQRLREHFMVEYTYHSNAIEGNTLTLHETSLVVLEGLTINKKPLKDHLEAIGHRDAFYYIVEKSKDNEPLTERTIKEIHSLVLMDDNENRGKYRELVVYISGSQEKLPHPAEVPSEIRQLLESYKSDNRHSIVKIADFHILFERIHPFIDGNGRTGRLVMNLELIKAGYAPINIKFQDRDIYMECFRDYEKTRSSDKFVELAAKYELDELKNMIAISAYKSEIND